MKQNTILPILAILAASLTFSGCLFNKAPEACFTSTTSGATVTFSSACTVDADSYIWDFGDGSSALSPNPSHTYAESGTYTVTLLAASEKGKNSSVTASVTVTVPGGGNDAFQGGTYSGTETCSVSGPFGPYAVSITPTANDNEVHVTNLWGFTGSIVTGTLNAAQTSITIARQNFGSQGYEVESTGTITNDGNTVTLNYTVYNNGSMQETCTLSLTR